MDDENPFNLPSVTLCDEVHDPDYLSEEVCSRLVADNTMPDGNRIFLISELIKQLSKLNPPIQPIQPPNLEAFDASQCKLLSNLSENYVEYLEKKDNKKKLEKEVLSSKEKIIQMFPELIKEKRDDDVSSSIFQMLGLTPSQGLPKSQASCTVIHNK